MKAKRIALFAILLSIWCVNPISAQNTTSETSPGALVMDYLSAAGALNPSATKVFLSKTCIHDIVTEFKTQRNLGWSFRAAEIIKETIGADANKATVKAEVDFEGGNSIFGRDWTFFLVLEKGTWRISGMDPLPSKQQPKFKPLSK